MLIAYRSILTRELIQGFDGLIVCKFNNVASHKSSAFCQSPSNNTRYHNTAPKFIKQIQKWKQCWLPVCINKRGAESVQSYFLEKIN